MARSAPPFFPFDEEALGPLCEAFDAFKPLRPVLEPSWDPFWHPWLRFGLAQAAAEAFEWSIDFLRGVHHVATEHQPDAAIPELAGVLRTGEYVAHDTDGHTYVAAPPDEIPQLVERALATVQNWSGHPALVGPWIYIAVTAIHPFDHCIDSLSRVAGCVALREAGYGPPLLPNCNDIDYDGLFAAQRCLGDQFDPTVDVTPFLSRYLKTQIYRGFHEIDRIWIEDPALFERVEAVRTNSGEPALARAVRLTDLAAGAAPVPAGGRG